MKSAMKMEEAHPDFAISVSLQIDAQESSPDAVTKSLRVFPSAVARKGEPAQTEGEHPSAVAGYPRHERNLWRLESSLSEVNGPLEGQVDALLERLNGKDDAVRKWAHGAQISVEAYAYKQVPHLTLAPRQMARMAELGIRLDVDLHDLTSDQDNTAETQQQGEE